MPKKTQRLCLDDFAVRDQAEEGVKVPLLNPKTGKETQEWLKILGTDSGAYRLAQAKHNKKRFEHLRNKDKRDDIEANLDFETEAERALVASLVVEWSLVDKAGEPVPCTPEEVEAFFYKAPQIQEQVAAFAGRRENFSNPSSPS